MKRNRVWRAVLIAALLAAAAMPASGQLANVPLVAAGPANPVSGFPTWFQDANGLDVQTDLFAVMGKLYAGTTLQVANNGADLTLTGGALKVSSVGNGPGTTLTIDGGALAADTVNATVVLQNGGVRRRDRPPLPAAG